MKLEIFKKSAVALTGEFTGFEVSREIRESSTKAFKNLFGSSINFNESFISFNSKNFLCVWPRSGISSFCEHIFKKFQ